MKIFIKLLITLILLIGMVTLFFSKERVLSSFYVATLRREECPQQGAEEYSHENSPFIINKIILYSSAYGTNKGSGQNQSSWLLDIYQYTDIAIFIDRNFSDLNEKNTIKKLYIENINFYNSSETGTPSLYYLDAKHFGNADYLEDYKILDKLEFTVLNDSNENNSIQTNTPVLFSDLSNPITLKYINNNIYNRGNYFEAPINTPIILDGTLIDIAKISVSSLETSFNFDIVLENNNNDTFRYKLNINIPLTNVYMGYDKEILENLNYVFLKE